MCGGGEELQFCSLQGCRNLGAALVRFLLFFSYFLLGFSQFFSQFFLYFSQVFLRFFQVFSGFLCFFLRFSNVFSRKKNMIFAPTQSRAKKYSFAVTRTEKHGVEIYLLFTIQLLTNPNIYFHQYRILLNIALDSLFTEQGVYVFIFFQLALETTCSPLSFPQPASALGTMSCRTFFVEQKMQNMSSKKWENMIMAKQFFKRTLETKLKHVMDIFCFILCTCVFQSCSMTCFYVFLVFPELFFIFVFFQLALGTMWGRSAKEKKQTNKHTHTHSFSQPAGALGTMYPPLSVCFGVFLQHAWPVALPLLALLAARTFFFLFLFLFFC